MCISEQIRAFSCLSLNWSVFCILQIHTKVTHGDDDEMNTTDLCLASVRVGAITIPKYKHSWLQVDANDTDLSLLPPTPTDTVTPDTDTKKKTKEYMYSFTSF